MPLLDAEVRGVASLESFSTLLLNPDGGSAWSLSYKLF